MTQHSELIECITEDREAGTPGKWTAQFLTNGSVFVGPMKAAIRSLSKVVAQFDASPEYNESYRSETRANARRIARLPDLEAAYIEQAAENEALKAKLERARKVKPLVWVDVYEYGTISKAKCAFGFYTVTQDEDSAAGRIFVEFHAKETGDCTIHAVELRGNFFEPEDAKAAAQADYERRILSALTDPMQTLADLGQEYEV